MRLFPLATTALVALSAPAAFASEAELHIPELNTVYNLFGTSITGTSILGWGMVVAAIGMIFGFI